MYRKEKNEADVRYILEHLRDEDKHEAFVQKGENWLEECVNDVMNTSEYFVLGCKKSDDTPVCMGGCAKTSEPGVGIVWLLTTPEVVDYQFCLLKNLKQDIKQLSKEYWMLCNMLFCENVLAKKWLQKFGFKFDRPFGANIPKDFEFFYKIRKTRGLKNANSTAIQ